MEKHVSTHLFQQLKHSPMVNIYFKVKRTKKARAMLQKPFKHEIFGGNILVIVPMGIVLLFYFFCSALKLNSSLSSLYHHNFMEIDE